MDDAEGALVFRGVAIVDRALVSIGGEPLAENPDLELTRSDYGGRPAVVLTRTDVAPFVFMLGHDLDVWIGPFSEVLLLSLADTTASASAALVVKTLRSHVAYERRRRNALLTCHLPGESPWLRLRVRPRGRSADLAASYEPYATSPPETGRPT